MIFDVADDAYERFMGRYSTVLGPVFADFAAIEPGLRVLDVGAGTGALTAELVQKAAVAGCPIMVAVGAPSSLAVELAADRGVTLCGFVRGGTANVYTEAWRIEH